MRSLTVSLIVLGLGCLSCGGFDRSPGARVAEATPTALDHAPMPLEVDADLFARVVSGALALRVRADILAELHSRHTALSDRELERLADTIVAESDRHQLDPSLVLAVIRVESGGYHLAVSPVGALGLMQLLPSTAEELARKHGHTWRGPNSLFDPILNVKLGTAYLRQLESKYGSITTALAAYNWGPGRIDRRLRRGGSIPRIYPEQVMKFYDAGSKPAAAASSRS